MKKILVLLLFLMLTSCGPFGKIKLIKDDFKNVNIVSLDLHNVSKRGEKGKRAMITNFTRIIDGKKSEQLKIKMKVMLYSIDNALSKTVFLKIDNTKFELVLDDIDSNSKSSSSTSTNSVTGKTETRSSSWEEHSGQLSIASTIKETLLKSSSFMIRVYAGDLPYDFQFSSGDLAKIKELLKYNISSK